MKDELRLFVAAALPPQLQEYLAEQAHVYQDAAIRLVPPRNLHLTLFFLGSTPLEALPALEAKLQEVAQRHAPFQLQLQCLQPGPKPRSPRLVWARFEPLHAFTTLVQDLTEQLSPEPRQVRQPIPHVTLARFRKDKPDSRALPTLAPPEAHLLPVAAIALWQSELVSPHPVYSELRRFPLAHNL